MNNARKTKDRLAKDLQVAQREIEIEKALERVRARALGMQESGEIMGVATAMRNEFEDLGYPIYRVRIAFYDRPDGMVTGWVAHPLTPREEDFLNATPRKLDRRVRTYRRWLKGERWWSEVTDKAAHSQLLRTISELEGWSSTRLRKQLAQVPDPLFDTYIRMARGYVHFGSAMAFTEADVDVAGRFVDVFAVAYQRFKELEEKEFQNRELTIQNALERVRARALGMQESTELGEVLIVLFDALAELGFEEFWCALALIDEDEDLMAISVQASGAEELVQSLVSIQDMIEGSPTSKAIMEAFRRGEEGYVLETAGKGIQDHFEFWSARIKVKNPEYRIPQLFLEAKTIFQSGSFFTDGLLEVGTPHAMGPDHRDVLSRFSDGFEFAYNRFLELKQKEDQNRELTIQNAIERVRARALGMQESSELDEVSVALFEAVGDVGIERNTTQLAIFDEEADAMQNYVQVKGAEDLVGCVVKMSEIVAGGKVLGANFLEAWRQGASHYFEELRGEEWLTHMNYWSNAMRETNPDYERPGEYPEADHRFILYAYNRFGGLGLSRPEPPIRQDEIEVMQRLSQVFEFAYSRFLDLKEKEEQARAADQRAAVDRVRAEATAMEGTEDIADVVKALWDGLVGQGFVFSTLVFRVEDEQEQELQMYLATLEGASGLAFPESHLLSRGMLEGVNLYRSTMPLGPETSARQVGRGVYSGLSEQVNVDMLPLWGFELPAAVLEDSQRLVVPFAYGQISVVRGVEPFSEADIERV